MKVKSIMLWVLMFLTLFGVTAVYAQTVDVGDSSFTIPDGYSVVNSTQNTVLLTDGENVITVYEGPIIDPDEAKEKRVEMGYNFIGEDTYDVDGIEINQQNYNDDGVYDFVYTFEKDEKTYIITFELDEDKDIPEYEDNPVTSILYSLN